MDTRHIYQPDYAIHPGETLAETLEELGMAQAELAQRMGRPLQKISEIVQGKKSITAETALQLERATQVPASFWNSAQRNYEATQARIEEERGLSAQLPWMKGFPMKALRQRGWIPRCESQSARMRALLDFFGVAGVSEWEAIWQAPRVAFRKSPAFEANPMAVAAWLRQGERLARGVRTAAYDPEAFVRALFRIRELTNTEPAQFEPEMTRLPRGRSGDRLRSRVAGNPRPRSNPLAEPA